MYSTRTLQRWMHAASVVAVVAALTTFAGLAHAAGQTLSTDQLLATLAEVIRDRAKSIAAHTIQKRLEKDFCGKDLKFTTPSLSLAIGGSDACKADKLKCTADDQFVQSCRLITSGVVPLQDATLLQALTDDTVVFAVRLAAAGSDAATLDSLHVMDVARSIASIARDAVRPDADDDAIVNDLLALVEKLGTSDAVAHQMLLRIRESDGARQLLATLTSKKTPFLGAHGQPVQIDAVAITDKTVDVDEQKLLQLRDAVEGALYTKDAKDTKQLRLFATAGCKADRNAPSDCQAIQVQRVVVALAKLWADPPLGNATSDLRNLAYVLQQYGTYEIGANEQFAAFIQLIRAVVDERKGGTPPGYVQLALSSSFEFGAYLSIARAGNAKATTEWLETLAQDLESFVDTCQTTNSPCDYSKLLSGPALGSSSDVIALARARAALKNLLVLPWLVAPDKVRAGDLYLTTVIASVRQFINRANAVAVENSGKRWSAKELARLVSPMLRMGSAVLGVDARAKSTPTAPADVALAKVGVAFAAAGNAFDQALNKEWVALATTAYQYASDIDAPDALKNSIAFTRMLLSVRQAETTADAKAVFQASLEDESSRERRWERFSVDLGALASARGTYGTTLVNDGASETWQREWSGGLYVPVGFMFDYKALGVLVYPLDVGAYLVGSSQDKAPTWPSAVRGGLAASLRPWPDVPIVFTASADARPNWQDDTPANIRGGLSIGMDLPLFIIY